MYQGRSLQELAAELERQQETKRDFVVDSRSMTFATEGKAGDRPGPSFVGFKVGDKEEAFPLTDLAHQQMAGRLKIPMQYYDRMRTEAPEILDQNVNGWLHRQAEQRMVRTLDGRARAILSNRYRAIDNLDVAENVLPVLSELGRSIGAHVESAELTERRMYIKVVNQRLTMEVSKGDIVQAGLVISNSEVGLGAVKVEPLIYRLVCLNGMIAQDYAQRKFHLGKAQGDEESVEMFRDETLAVSDKAFMMKVQDTVRAACDQTKFSIMVKNMQAAASKVIEGEPMKVVEVLQKREGLTEKEHNSVLKHLLAGGDLTQYGLLNAVTRAAQDVDNYERATELERLGGKLLGLSSADWNTLSSVA